VGAWFHEAAPEHLFGGAAARERRAGRCRHGGRQPSARCRGRDARRHARRAAASRRLADAGCSGARRSGDTLSARAVAVADARLKARAPLNLTYRDLTTLEEFAQGVELERVIWGPGYDEVVALPI